MSKVRTNPSPLIGAALLAVLTTCTFCLRLIAPSDLLDNDQLRPAMYALDIVLHGHWAVQTDLGGEIASKPPLYAWLVAVSSLPAGRVTLFTLYLPCAVAIGFTATCIYVAGRRLLGDLAAFCGGAMVVLSAYGFKHVTLARTDAVFMACVCAAALLAWRAWSMGSRPGVTRRACTLAWALAWSAAALATLTKGPLGVVLAGMGLLAVVFERRASGRSGLRGTHWLGAAIWVALVGGWFVAAYAAGGEAFIDKVIGRELVGHVIGTSKENPEVLSVGERIKDFVLGLGKPTVYIVGQFLPWSLLTVLGLIRVVRHPSSEADERRFERFLACWLTGGVVLFSFMPHQRADLLLPLVPAAALLAGREAARPLAGRRPMMRGALVGGIVLAAMGGAAYHYVVHNGASRDTQQSEGTRATASRVREFLGTHPGTRVIDVDANGGIQFFLGMKQPRVEVEEGVGSLLGPNDVVVLTRDPDALQKLLPSPARVLARWPADGPAFVAALTNVPDDR